MWTVRKTVLLPWAFFRDKAAELGIVFACTGAVDYVADGKRLAAISNGHPMMAKVTGTGCTATALTGAFVGSCDDPWLASVSSFKLSGNSRRTSR